MREKWKWFLILCVCVLLCGAAPVKADEKIIPLDGNWISDNIGNSVAFYKFSIPSAGTVTYTMQSYSTGGCCELFNEDLSRAYSYIGECNGSTTNPETKNQSNVLEAGTYYLKTKGWDWWIGDSDWTGNYRLKATFTPANNNEVEPNNTFDTAMPLSGETMITGLMSEDDNLDFYQFTLSSMKTVEFILTTDGWKDFSIWNGDLISVENYGSQSGSHSIEIDLEPGLYYIKINTPKYKDGNGTYTLKYRYKQYVSDIKLKKSKYVMKKGKTYSLLKSVLPADATTKKLEWTSSNTSVATVSGGGKVKAKGAGYATITAKTTDGTNISKSCTIIVKPSKTKIKSLKLNTWNKRRVDITVKSVNGASGYQYYWSKSKKFKTKRKSSSYSSSVYVYNLPKYTRYYFKVRPYVTCDGKNYYGEWSKIRSIKTKK